MRPSTIAPAAFIRATTGASRDGSECSSAGTPWVVAEPTQSMFSLTVKGTPCNGPLAAPRRRASAASAAASADSLSTTVTALT